ncbi:MAG: EAL domain-containing protein [Gammaproteobacteria bacterium]|nr:EAL domain-containing protein [Gammaproteobacteria bacterium]
MRNLTAGDHSLLTHPALMQALDSVQDAVMLFDCHGNVHFANSKSEELVVWQEIGGRRSAWLRLKSEQTNESFERPVIALTDDRELQRLSLDCHLLTPGDISLPFKASLKPYFTHSEDLEPQLFILTLKDESQTVMLQKSLNFHRKHDQLTGLANRNELERQLIEAIHDARVNHSCHGLCMVKVEQVKLVNDVVGHHAGNELIKAYASHIKASIRSNDILARVGNNDFAILLWQLDQVSAQAFAEKLKLAVKQFAFKWERREFRVTGSIGMVEIDRDSDSWVQVFSRADLASQESHLRGENEVTFYRDIAEKARNYQSEVEWVAKIVSAVRNNSFALFYQPIVALDDNRSLSHCELLLRMQGENGQVIAPGAFLLAAEKYNMIDLIDRWVVLNAFRYLAENRDIQVEHLNINLSAMSITRPEFLHYINDITQSYLVPTEKVCFEITETCAVENMANAIEFIHGVKALGCKIALDDFGTGMSSFSYLKNLPVDYLKIDGEFIREVATSNVSSAMVRAINEVAHEMNIKTVAEYVESRAIERTLAKIGVDYAQGYAVSEPQPLTQLYQQLNSLELSRQST